MSIPLDSLNPEFRHKVEQVLSNCRKANYEIVPYFAVRGVHEQSRLWRQSRPWYEIKKAVIDLKTNGAFWLAEVLEGVGPQYGRWATNALPGQSWHQYGMAVDCFVLEDKQAVWKPFHRGYAVYAAEAVALGLGAGYFWTDQDSVHIQYYQSPVLSTTTWATVDEMMRNKWGRRKGN